MHKQGLRPQELPEDETLDASVTPLAVVYDVLIVDEEAPRGDQLQCGFRSLGIGVQSIDDFRAAHRLAVTSPPDLILLELGPLALTHQPVHRRGTHGQLCGHVAHP